MPTDLENVREPRKTGSGQRTRQAASMRPSSLGHEWPGLAAYNAPIASA